MALVLTLALASAISAEPKLDLAAQLLKSEEKILVFKIKNDSDIAISFDQARTPCDPNELATIVFIGNGGIGKFIERNPLIADSVSRNRTLLPHHEYVCSFNISHWFYGKIPSGEEARLLWSFHPGQQGAFKQPLYGGSFLLEKN